MYQPDLPVFMLGLRHFEEPRLFSYSADPLTVTAALAFFRTIPASPTVFVRLCSILRPHSLTWCTAVGAHFRPLQLSGHLESRSNGEVDECSDVIHPLAQLSNRRLPSTDAAPESPEAGCWGCLRGQIAAKFPGG